MFKDAFTKLDEKQAARLIEIVGPFLDGTFDPHKTSVMTHDLSFYPGYFLAEFSRHDQNPPVMCAAVCNKEGKVHVLNWTNEVIYALNAAVPLTLTPETAPDYIRFFFHYVRGSHGRFVVIDNVDDIDWREEPAPAGRKALGRMIEPMHLKSREKDGTRIFSLCFVFKDSLFSGEAHITPDGQIALHNEELLVEDIPVADDLFGQ